MKKATWPALLSATIVALVRAQPPASSPESAPSETTFESVSIYLQSAEARVAAYQVEIWDSTRSARIVGIEGGDDAAFREPPHYDPAALQNNRIVLADFSTKPDLPPGRVRIARLHVAVNSTVKSAWQTRLVAAASSTGDPVHAEVTLSNGDGK